MKVELTYEVVVTIDNDKVKYSDVEAALTKAAEKLGQNVGVDETDCVELVEFDDE